MDTLKRISSYLLSKIPLKNPFYFVGGTVRDELLNRPYTDIDISTPYLPSELAQYLKDEESFSLAFARFGTLSFRLGENEVTFTTMRKEGEYTDHRHPKKIEFVKDPADDALRRDFTVNAMYLSPELVLLDPLSGKKDLDSKVLRMVGDPMIRLKEDPLRILRAYRFQEELGFSFDPELEDALNREFPLLKEIRKEKIEMELAKFPPGTRGIYRKKALGVLD
jgi:tRNA nucleotidyltransferase/poly(A) polymerase